MIALNIYILPTRSITSFNMKTDTQEIKTGFAVHPKLDCPHLTETYATGIASFLSDVKHHTTDFECNVCSDKTENWVCLDCKKIFCSRYVKQHMAIHNAQVGHPITLSFSDGSYWCYACESYIDSALLRPARKALTELKVKQQKEKEEKESKKNQEGKEKEEKSKEQKKKEQEDVAMLEKMFKFLGIKDKKKEYKTIELDQIVQKMKKNQYKRVVVLTGAGLSVSAGIPDFRSPGTGLYSKLQAYKLPYPQAIFEINFFKKTPKPFLTLCKQLLTKQFQPTLGHHFIKKLHDQGLLHMNLTQNIDDLEIKAGIPEHKLIQAHGHSRSAHCIGCKKEASIEKWKQFAAKEQALTCQDCNQLIKPDIIFFGEQLPKRFFQAPQILGEADLAIIIGTSLKVMPFAYLAELIPEKAPVILINRQDVMQDRDYKLWLGGDIDQNVREIMKRLQWL